MQPGSLHILLKLIFWMTFLTVIRVPGASMSVSSRGYTQQAIDRLSQVFGINQVPTMIHHRSPPEYMLELYRTVAFSDGISRRANPYDADVVRGFPDRATKHQTRYYFNVSYVTKTEDVLAAEFHLYKMKPQFGQPADVTQRPRNQHIIQIQLYQVLVKDWESGDDGLQLLLQKRISAHASGWEKFVVTRTIQQWINNSDSNHGFLVTASTVDGTPVNVTFVRFAQKLEHHDSKQPLLIVFSGDMMTPKYFLSKNLEQPMNEDQGTSEVVPLHNGSSVPEDVSTIRQQYIQFLNEDYRDRHGGHFPYERYRNFMSPSEHQRFVEDTNRLRTLAARRQKRPRRARSRRDDTKRSRSRRSTDYYRFPRRKHKGCQRQDLYVDFDEIGWSGWIISPKGYNAYHCMGECPFPLGQYHKPTNHATVQSIVYTMRIVKGIQLPCCVPDKLFSISLLYFDDEENVILKQYDEMVAASCGCH